MSVTAAKGFAAAGVSAGIRPSGKPDVALVRSLVPAVGAAMWTQNRVLAAPVVLSKRHLETAQPQAVVVNAGVANAATGAAGEEDARVTAADVASLLGLAQEEVLVLSTGVIGPRLPMAKLRAGVADAAAALSSAGGDAAAEAILTTDAGPKTAVVEGDGFTVGGMAKGAGMIHPNLATMLVVLTTDYPLEAGEVDAFLRPAVDRSFNRISVDGDCSTNDAVVLLANGASGVTRDTASDESFAEALGTVCADLARQIVADGEGATVVLEIHVSHARSDDEAHAIARRVATSPLVKTAAFGRAAATTYRRVGAATRSTSPTVAVTSWSPETRAGHREGRHPRRPARLRAGHAHEHPPARLSRTRRPPRSDITGAAWRPTGSPSRSPARPATSASRSSTPSSARGG